jgi:hypothetical protein
MNGGRQSGVYTSLDPHLQLLELLARTRKFTNENSQIYEAGNFLIVLCSCFLNRFDWHLTCAMVFVVLRT